MFYHACVGLRFLPTGTEGTEFSLLGWSRLRGFFRVERLIPLLFTRSRDVKETVGSCFAVDSRVAEWRVLYGEKGSCSTGTLMAQRSESCFLAKGTH
jgi:hypothetical protein